jgi:hypothetical protein
VSEAVLVFLFAMLAFLVFWPSFTGCVESIFSELRPDGVLTADCGDIDPGTPCMCERLCKALGVTLRMPHAGQPG